MTNVMENVKEFFGLGYNTAYDEPMDMDVNERDQYYEHTPTIVKAELFNFEHAPRIGHPFRDGDCVVFDIKGMSTADARRIVDFAAGLCFAAKGKMLQLESRVFALVPEHADISKEELRSALR